MQMLVGDSQRFFIFEKQWSFSFLPSPFPLSFQSSPKFSLSHLSASSSTFVHLSLPYPSLFSPIIFFHIFHPISCYAFACLTFPFWSFKNNDFNYNLYSYCLFQLSPDCRYLQTTVLFEIGTEKFSYTGKQLIDPGYTIVMPWQALSSDEKMPEFKREQICPVSDVSISCHNTCSLKCSPKLVKKGNKDEL